MTDRRMGNMQIGNRVAKPQGSLEKVLEGLFAAVDSLAAQCLALERAVAKVEKRLERLERGAKPSPSADAVDAVADVAEPGAIVVVSK